MAYQPGTATSPADLLQKLVTFLIANGWVQDQSAADGSGWRAHLHNGSVYVNLRAAVNEGAASLFDSYYTAPWSGIAFYLGNGYSSGSTWKNQAGGPKNADTPAQSLGLGMSLPQGAVSGYHFFADATGGNIVVVVEKSAGVFVNMGWGTSMQKLGSWTGGTYFFGATGYYLGQDPTQPQPGFAQSAACPGTYGDASSMPSCYVRVDVDSFTNKWIGIGNPWCGYYGATGKSGSSCVYYGNTQNSFAPSYRYYTDRLTNSLNGQSLLLPIRLLVDRDAGGHSFIGNIPSVFLCNATSKGFTPATVYPWGTDNYMVFPGPSSYPQYGFAVKKA